MSLSLRKRNLSLAAAAAVALSLALLVILLFTSTAFAFSARTSRPAANNANYYSSANPYYSNNLAPTGNKNSKGVYVTGNCTWYAWGRMKEINGSAPKIVAGDPQKMWNYAVRNHTYETGKTAKVGALCIGISSGSWHVSVVEAISNGKVYVSESGYGTSSRRPNASTIRFHYGLVTSWMNGGITGYIYVTPSNQPHIHNYNQRVNVAYSYYNDVRHNVRYIAKCSCGATGGAKSELEGCTFAWRNNEYRCSKCGTKYVDHTAGFEYITSVNTPIYKGDNPSTGIIGNIPSNTVIKPGVQSSLSSWGRYIAKVSYDGVTGYIHLANCKLHNSMILTGATYPTTLQKGKAYPVKGTIASPSKMTYVSAAVYNSAGKWMTGGSCNPNSTTYNLAGLDNKVIYNILSPGTYTYAVHAKNSSGQVCLLSKQFTVSSGYKAPYVSGANWPTSIKRGKFFGLKGTVYGNGSNLRQVTAAVYTTGGARKTGKTINVNCSSVNIAKSLDPYVVFNHLPRGTYNYKVIAKNSAGTYTLVNKRFKVY